ncbi:MAG: hypothetical protein RLZ10_2050 [Bacteroidota bacterium]|jgi:hypothetical protein
MTKIIAYIIVILEGGALLSYEIMASKMYTPHVGATLYVWTSILTITLISLALSYRLSQKWVEQKKWNILPYALIISGLYILLMVFFRNEILQITYSMELISTALLTGLILLLIPIMGMGITSPMLSGWLTENQSNDTNNSAGNFAGMIYGLGTLAGVGMTLISLFVVMPKIGVNNTIMMLAIMLIIAGGLSFNLMKKNS